MIAAGRKDLRFNIWRNNIADMIQPMRDRRPREFDPDQRLRHCDKWPTSFSWPAPMDSRLNALVDAAIDAGEADALSRAELISALVLSAPLDGEHLRELLGRYRKASVRDALPFALEGREEGVVQLSERRPGRRA